nr:gag pol polyprotein [Hymenolepis microstoma]
MAYPVLRSVKRLRRYLGVVNNYGKFFLNCAQFLQAVTDLLKGYLKHFTMTSEAESASSKLIPTETRYITSAVKHFRHILEAQQFTIFIYHKSVIYAIRPIANYHSPREIPHTDFTLQSTNDNRHINGASNVVADVMSRLELN